MRRILLLFILFTLTAFGQSEKFNHVQWKLTLDQATAKPGAEILGKLEATIAPEWHMYSLTTPPGPIPTTIPLEANPGVAKVTIFQPPPLRKFDPNFNADTETYEGTQVFLARIQLKKDVAAGPLTIAFKPRYQTCSGTSCIPPKTREASAVVTVDPSAQVAALAIPSGYKEAKTDGSGPSKGSPATGTEAGGLGAFLGLAFGFGLAAIFTPCVFPMIPITMSYFVGQKSGGLGQAITFCLGIIFLFTSLGIVMTLALGPAGVVQLGSNAWVNGFISLVFFTFGLSLLGAFEITIPSGLLTKLNSASGQGGFIGTLLMGLTFALA
jgi:thiol:disulfide interchange protein